MVKLYVLTGMLEVFNKLLSSFGIDAFDNLYSKTRGNKWWEIPIALIIVVIYVVCHSLLYFAQVATLVSLISNIIYTSINLQYIASTIDKLYVHIS